MRINLTSNFLKIKNIPSLLMSDTINDSPRFGSSLTAAFAASTGPQCFELSTQWVGNSKTKDRKNILKKSAQFLY